MWPEGWVARAKFVSASTPSSGHVPPWLQQRVTLVYPTQQSAGPGPSPFRREREFSEPARLTGNSGDLTVFGMRKRSGDEISATNQFKPSPNSFKLYVCM